jgi:surfactin synthase thioesterase subunit
MFEVIPLELPGRGKRMNEPLLVEFDEAAKDLYDQVMARLAVPEFLIYGHSMGAYLALRVANMLERAGRLPACVVVSGNAGPDVKTKDKKIRYLLEREEFIEEVKILGGLPQAIIENKELLGFFEPVLRADFEIVERNRLEEEPAIQAHLYAMMGSGEENVAFINNWSKFTKGRFNAEILEGDHFFIHRHPARVAGIINSFYQGLRMAPSH